MYIFLFISSVINTDGARCHMGKLLQGLHLSNYEVLIQTAVRQIVFSLAVVLYFGETRFNYLLELNFN